MFSIEDIDSPDQKRLLEVFLSSGQLSEAIKAAQVSMHRHYQWLDTCPAYREIFYREWDMVTDGVMDIAVDRVTHGYQESTTYKRADGSVKEIQEYNRVDNNLLMKLLAMRKDEKHPANKWLDDQTPVSLSKACKQLATVLEAMGDGPVTPEKAGAMSRLAMAMTHLVQVGELEDRIVALEERVGEEPS